MKVQDGASVITAYSQFKTDDHSVKFKIDFENHTDQKLELLEKFELSGEWGEIPQHIDPGKRESSFGRKYSGTATGVAGTVSWKIENGDCAVVMFSLPFDFNLYSNWLSVGIMKESEVKGHPLFDKMYSGKESNFTRGQFYSNPKPIEFKNGSYKIVGEMGTTHEAKIKIQIFDEQKEKALAEAKAKAKAEDEAKAKAKAETKAKGTKKALKETKANEVPKKPVKQTTVKEGSKKPVKQTTVKEGSSSSSSDSEDETKDKVKAKVNALVEAGAKALTETEAKAKAIAEAKAKAEAEAKKKPEAESPHSRVKTAKAEAEAKAKKKT